MLTKQAIKEFQKIHFNEYGEQLSFQDAQAQAEALLRLYKVIYIENPQAKVKNNG